MSSTRFGYKDDTPLTLQDMESYVDASVSGVIRNTENDVPSTANNFAFFPNRQTQEIKTSALLQQSVDANSLSVHGTLISTDPNTALYSTQPNAALGTTANPFKRVHTTEISLSGNIVFDAPHHDVGSILIPVQNLYTRRIHNGDQTALEIQANNIDLKDLSGNSCGRIKIDGKTGDLKISGDQLKSIELQKFIPLTHYPSAVPLLFEQVIYSFYCDTALSTPTVSTYYLTEFPSRGTFGNLTLPVFYPGTYTRTLRFSVQGTAFGGSHANRKLNLVAAASQDPVNDDDPNPEGRFMRLYTDTKLDDLQAEVDAGTERAFEWTTIMRFPYNGDFKRVGLNVHSMFRFVTTNNTLNYMGSLVGDWTGRDGAAGQRMNTEYPFNVNIGLAWDTVAGDNNTKTLKIHRCTVTMCPF
jgi:hypothetical protein